MGEQHANGSRVSRHRLHGRVIANPMSGRDIRRLVASASVLPNAEKASMVVRADGRRGSARGGPALVSTDTFGVSAAVQPELFTQVGAGTCSPRRRTGMLPWTRQPSSATTRSLD
jgi:predicted polyphosphate/ATP-dependent NAD kinase